MNWGGTVIQTWTSPESIAHCNGTGDSNLYHSLLNPFFVGPLALTGAVWYQVRALLSLRLLRDVFVACLLFWQGENNGGQEEYYKCAFPTMIQDWRARLAMPNMWFGGVQLAPASNGVYAENFVGIRDAQLSIFTLSNTSLATAMDLGDALSPFGDYHPRLKQPVRALIVRARSLFLTFVCVCVGIAGWPTPGCQRAGEDLWPELASFVSRVPERDGRYAVRPQHRLCHRHICA